MKSLKVLLGAMLGAAAGGLAGILYAPEKGTETRKRILKRGEDYTDSLKGKLDELRDVVTGKFEKAKKDVTRFAEKQMHKPAEAEKNAKTKIEE